MTKWYSTNEEDYRHTEIEAAIAEAFDDSTIKAGEIRSIWEGDAIIRRAGSYAPFRMVEELSERAYDECGEYAEDWPDCSKEQEHELEQRIAAAINSWADDFGHQPTFGTVGNVREIKVRLTSEDGAWEYV